MFIYINKNMVKYNYKRVIIKKGVTRGLSEFQKEFRKRLLTFIIGAFSFVSALVWNDAIRELVKQIQFEGNVIIVKFITALVVSVFAVIIIIALSKINEKIDANSANK